MAVEKAFQRERERKPFERRGLMSGPAHSERADGYLTIPQIDLYRLDSLADDFQPVDPRGQQPTRGELGEDKDDAGQDDGVTESRDCGES